MKKSATGNIYKITRNVCPHNSDGYPYQITSGKTLVSSHRSLAEAKKIVRKYYRGDEAYIEEKAQRSAKTCRFCGETYPRFNCCPEGFAAEHRKKQTDLPRVIPLPELDKYFK